jgi:hypothetical protein
MPDKTGKNIDVRTDLFFCLILLVLLAVFFIAASGYKPVTRRAPLLVMIPLAFMLLIEALKIIQKLRSLKRVDPTLSLVPKIDRHKLRKAAQILVWLIVLLGMIYVGGHIGGIAIFLLIFLKFVSRESWKITIGVSVGMTVGLFFLFEKILNVLLYRGIIYEIVSAWLWS